MVNDTCDTIQTVPDYNEQAVQEMHTKAEAEYHEAVSAYHDGITAVVHAKAKYGHNDPLTYEAIDERNDAKERLFRSHERVKTLRDVLRLHTGE